MSGNASLVGISTVVTGAQLHTFVIMQNGEVYGWGLNSNGQLGLGFSSTTRRPSRVLLPQPCVAVSIYDAQNLYCGVYSVY